MTELHSYLFCVPCRSYIKTNKHNPHEFKMKHAGHGHKIYKEAVDIDLDKMSPELRELYFKSIR